MLVFGKNVAKDLLLNGVNINKIYLQDGFDDKSILSLIEKSNYKVEYKQKKEIAQIPLQIQFHRNPQLL